MSMYSQYVVSGYNITADPAFQNERNGNAKDLMEQFKELYFESRNKKNKKDHCQAYHFNFKIS